MKDAVEDHATPGPYHPEIYVEYTPYIHRLIENPEEEISERGQRKDQARERQGELTQRKTDRLLHLTSLGRSLLLRWLPGVCRKAPVETMRQNIKGRRRRSNAQTMRLES